MGTNELSWERDRRLARERDEAFAKAHYRELGPLPTPTRSRRGGEPSSWLEERRDETGSEPKRGTPPYDLDRYGSLEAAEEALGLRAKPQPVSHRNVVEATTAIFRELRPRDGKVLVHYYEDQWTYKQVAEELNIAVMTAHEAVKRALNHARKVADGLGITQLWAHGKLVNLPAYEDESPGALLAEDQTEVGGAGNTRVRKYHGPLRGADMVSVRVKQLDGTYRHETCAKLGEGPLDGPGAVHFRSKGGETAFLAGRSAWWKRRPDARAYKPEFVGSPFRPEATQFDLQSDGDVKVELGIPFHRMFEKGLVAALTKFSEFWGEGECDEAKRKLAERKGH